MATTPLQGFPYPALTDPPNGPAQIQALANAVEPKSVMVFNDATDRDSKVTSTIRAAGMIAYLKNPGIHTWFDGSNWRPVQGAAPAFFTSAPALTITPGQSNSVSTNITVPPLVTTMTGFAVFDVGTFYSAAEGSTIECVVFYSGGTIGDYYWKSFPASSSTARNTVTVPFQVAVTAGAKAIICRVVNHNSSGGASCNYYNLAFTGNFS